MLLEAAIAFAVICLIEPFSVNLNMLLGLQFASGLASGFFVPLTLSFVLRNMPPRVWAYGIAIYALNLEVSLNISASLEGWYVGFASGGLGLALIYAALDQGNRLDWLSSRLVIGLLASGLTLLAAFFVHERTIDSAAVDFKVVFAAPMPRLLVLVAFLRLIILSTGIHHPAFSRHGPRLSRDRGGANPGVDRRSSVVRVLARWLPPAAQRSTSGLFRRLHLRLLCLSDGRLRADPLVGHGPVPAVAAAPGRGSELCAVGNRFFRGSAFASPGRSHFRGRDSDRPAHGGRDRPGVHHNVRTCARTGGLQPSRAAHPERRSSDNRTHPKVCRCNRARGRSTVCDRPRGAGVLANVVRQSAVTQGIIDSLVVIAAMTALTLLLIATRHAAPLGPASHVPLFRPSSAPDKA